MSARSSTPAADAARTSDAALEAALAALAARALGLKPMLARRVRNASEASERGSRCETRAFSNRSVRLMAGILLNRGKPKYDSMSSWVLTLSS